MNDSINYLEIGARIRRQREQIGLTQEQLGEACDLSTSFVGHIERGSRKLSVESLFRIASVLGISADSLLFDRMEQETTLPPEIASFLKGTDPAKKNQFWRTVRILAGHIEDM